MKKIIIGLLLVVIIASISATPGIINDNSVRMRDLPNVSGKILNMYNKNTKVEILGKEFSSDVKYQEYYWIYCQINEKIGWIYGEFISTETDSEQIISNRISNFNESNIINQKRNIQIYIGMTKDLLINNLGIPDKIVYDDIDNNDTYKFNNISGLTILVNHTTNRISHLVLRNSEFKFSSGFGVGDNIDKVIASTVNGEIVEQTRFVSEINIGNKSSYYESSVIIFFNNTTRIIEEIQIGNPQY